MAGKAFIADIRNRLESESRSFAVKGTFLVHDKQVPLNKNGNPYLALVLKDRDGTVNAKMWDNVEETESKQPFGAGDFILVECEAQTYRGHPQLKIKKLSKVTPPGGDELADYLGHRFQFDHINISAHHAGNIFYQIAGALKVLDDTEHRYDPPQVFRDGLLLGQQLMAVRFDMDIESVDLLVGIDYSAGQALVPFNQRRCRPADRLGHILAHPDNISFEILERQVKFLSHLAEPPGDVVFRPLVFGIREDARGLIELNQLTVEKKAGLP